MRQMPLDAIPDLSDTQVIIYSRWDRSPDIIEDQVTYPIVTAMLGAPKVKAIRGFSDFGYSYAYVIFEDGTDICWARSRTIEYLSKILPRLPEGVRSTAYQTGLLSLGNWPATAALVQWHRARRRARRQRLRPQGRALRLECLGCSLQEM
jgi:Cu(I)/Ag(I) efflux system membrane protein CusA/SilA